jgi:hypothetical protein
MPLKHLAENVTGDVTTEAIALRSSQVEIVVTGTFDSIEFEDNKYDLGWASVLDSATGTTLVLTEATNELQLISATNTVRKIRANIVNGDGVTIAIDEGIL